MTNKVDVVIGGKIIAIRSAESAEHMQKVASYVDKKIEEVKSKNIRAAADERLLTLLLSINLADDVYKAKDQLDKLQTKAAQLGKDGKELQEENDHLRTQVHKLREDLRSVTSEFEEFLENLGE